MTELIGQRLGDYQLEALLATGAIGSLYRARHVRLGRVAAVRLFDAGLLARPALQPRLLAALRTVAALRHPNLAAIFDVGEQAGQLFMASDLPAGGSLRELPRETPLATRLELLAQAADGLAHAHGAGVVHGAVRPDLLLLEPRPAAATPLLKLSGLGIAALLPELALEAPAYLSPEQCRGLALDGRADLYSLGVVLYEQLVGVPPFKADSLEAVINKHLRTSPVPPRLVRPQVPAALEAIVLRCLAKAPAERFADGAALAAELRQVAGDLAPATTQAAPISASPAPTQAAPISARPAPQIAIFGSQGVRLRDADLSAGKLSLGRAPEHDLFLDDPQVSRDQLRLDWDGRQITVTDLGSSNGSFLGGARLPAGLAIPWDGRVPLRAGPFTLRVEGLPGAAGATAPLDDSLLSGLLEPAAAPTPPPLTPPVARIELRLDQDRVLITPGSPTVVPVRLVNSGQTAVEASFAVEGVPGAWLRAADMPVLRLAPGAEANTSLLVNAPRDPATLAGDYQVTLRAQSIGAPAETGTARMRWTVASFADLDLRLIPPRNESRGPVDYQIVLSNLGNAPTTCLLSFEDDGTLGFTLAQDEVPLAAGQSVRVGLNVEAAGRLFGAAATHRFVIRAESSDGQNRLTEGELVDHASLPPWAPFALLGGLVLIALILVAGAFLGQGSNQAAVPSPVLPLLPTATATPLPTPQPGAPAILEFRVLPELTSPGELVRVVWNVQGADRVIIDRFGDVPPVGERDFRPEQTTEFRLSAFAGERESTAITYANVAPATPTALPPPTETPLPLPTEVPPLPTEVPPLPTETPLPLPTETPLPPPTEAPPLPTEAPPPAEPTLVTLELVELAPRASWSTDADRVSFGRPLFFANRGGWADLADATLEDDQRLQSLLLMVPPGALARDAETDRPYIQGEFTLPTLGPGQILAGAIGFAQGINSEPLNITVSFNGQVIFEASKAPDGSLLPIFADLSAYAGQAGPLTLRVSGPPSSSPQGIYWVRPRIDVPR
jgi:eukaryotic-like serine/threonine-protein kinase